MSLTLALVDVGRTVRKIATGERVEGKRMYADQVGPPFRCRLGEGDSDERLEDGRLRVEVRHELVYELRDENGDPVDLGADQRVRVFPAGTATPNAIELLVAGQPVTPRRRGDAIVGIASVVRITEPPGG